ncbi:MATE family efflux transporter [Dorea sp. D27]|uniref:MATE family efflux transporter n=1 Tax=Dorea sp. D27 TaxID=658665 RepID=UPI0006A16DEC|nr:MATE family efflux transporter [Dorea sp. D27]KMZ52773.1 putative Na+-driven multidrug efflux pump [Dorea sp. D27]
MKIMKEVSQFTEGKILSPLIGFALPVLLAIFLQTMYGAVDMLIVGQFSEAAQLSAVSTGSWVMQTVTSAIVGLSMGTTIILGQRIGEGKQEAAGRAVGVSICLFAVIGIAVTVLLELLAVPITVMMKVPQAAFESTVSYLRICAAGAVFIVAYNVIGSVFRGVGDSRMPLLTVAIACVGNIAGDLLFVGAFHMAAEGAAVATVLAQALSVILSAWIIRRRNLPFSFRRRYIRLERNIAARIIKLGFPIALQDVLVSISFLAITAIVNTLGVVASAGVGVAEKICGFILLVPSAFMQSISAFVAQNVGARKPGRAKRALLYSILVSLGIGVFLAWFAFFHGDVLAGIFNKDSRVIAAAADYLKAYAVDCLLVSFMFCFTGYFNGCGKTAFVMLQGIAGAFGVRIPVSYLMSQIVPVSLFRIGLATPASTLLQIVLCAGYYIWIEKRAAAAAR